MNKVLLVIAALLAVTWAQGDCSDTIFDTPQMLPVKLGTTYSTV